MIAVCIVGELVLKKLYSGSLGNSYYVIRRALMAKWFLDRLVILY